MAVAAHNPNIADGMDDDEVGDGAGAWLAVVGEEVSGVSSKYKIAEVGYKYSPVSVSTRKWAMNSDGTCWVNNASDAVMFSSAVIITVVV